MKLEFEAATKDAKSTKILLTVDLEESHEKVKSLQEDVNRQWWDRDRDLAHLGDHL